MATARPQPGPLRGVSAAAGLLDVSDPGTTVPLAGLTAEPVVLVLACRRNRAAKGPIGLLPNGVSMNTRGAVRPQYNRAVGGGQLPVTPWAGSWRFVPMRSGILTGRCVRGPEDRRGPSRGPRTGAVIIGPQTTGPRRPRGLAYLGCWVGHPIEWQPDRSQRFAFHVLCGNGSRAGLPSLASAADTWETSRCGHMVA